MENKTSTLKNMLLWVQLMCFVIAVSFVAGGGQTPDNVTGYNNFFYFKALFLVLPFLTTVGWMSISFFNFFDAFKIILKKHAMLLLYFVFAYISLIFAYDRIFSIGRLIYTSVAVLSLWCLMAQYKMIFDDVGTIIYRHLLNVFVVFLIGIPVMAMLHSGGSMALTDMRGAIQMTGLIHPNTVASVCAYAVFHVLFYPSEKTVSEKIKCCVVFTLALVLMGTIFSRSVIVAFIISFIITGWFAFIWFRSYRSLAAIGAVGFVGVFSLLLIYLGALPLEAIVSSISRTKDGMDLLTLTHRIELWQRLFETLDTKILMLGNGYAVMTSGFGIDFGTGIIYGAHNIYLSILFGTGIFSLIAFLGYLGNAFLSIRKHHTLLGAKVSLHGVTLLSFFMIHSMTSTEFSLNLSISFALIMVMITLGFDVKGKSI